MTILGYDRYATNFYVYGDGKIHVDPERLDRIIQKAYDRGFDAGMAEKTENRAPTEERIIIYGNKKSDYEAETLYEFDSLSSAWVPYSENDPKDDSKDEPSTVVGALKF